MRSPYGGLVNDDAFLGRLRKLVEILLGYFDLFAQSGSFDIPCGDVYGVAVNVVTIDLMCEFTFLRLVVVNPVKHLLVEVRPFLKSISLRNTPGAMPRAMSAASMAIVPEPHIGLSGRIRRPSPSSGSCRRPIPRSTGLPRLPACSRAGATIHRNCLTTAYSRFLQYGYSVASPDESR